MISSTITRRLSQIQKNGIYMDAPKQEEKLDEDTNKKLVALEGVSLLDAQEMRNQNTGHGVAGAVASIRVIFDEIDEDGSGVLEGHEIDTLMGTLGLTGMQGRQAMKAMDANGDGDIDFDEFHSWFKRMLFGLSDPNNMTNFMVDMEKAIIHVQKWVARVHVTIEELDNELEATETTMKVFQPKRDAVSRDLEKRLVERANLKRQIERHEFLMKTRDKDFLNTIMPSKMRLKHLRHIDAFAKTGQVKKLRPGAILPRRPKKASAGSQSARQPMNSPVLSGRWMTGGPLERPSKRVGFGGGNTARF